MYLDRIAAAGSDTPLVVPHGLARQQWEAVLGAPGASGPQSVWPSRPLTTWAAWLAERWEAAGEAGLASGNRLVLSPGQTNRLWRRVIEESGEADDLIGSAGAAHWARSARRALLDAGLAPDRWRGPLWQHDAAALGALNARFEAYLDRNDWIDPDALLYRIARLPSARLGQDLIVLDSPPAHPERERLLTRWREDGFGIEWLEPDDHRASARGIVARDPEAELRLAADWAAERLETAGEARLAIVVPDLAARRDEIETALADALGRGRVVNTAGPGIGEIGVFGAALDAIRLLAPGAGFEILSRWLRSPFFASPDAARARHAAALEIEYRRDPRAQRDFVEAWRSQGLKASFAKRLPGTAAQVDAALARLPRRATPTAWSEAWQGSLRALGWRGYDLELAQPLQSAWDGGWAGFAALTPIVGSVGQSFAVAMLAEAAASATAHEPMRLGGVHLVSRLDQIGPGFAGARILGMTEDAIPPPTRPNPFVPWPVQTEHGLPGASPDRALENARASLDRLLRRVPEAVLSCPERVGDRQQLPSPLFGDWHRAANGGSGRQVPRSHAVGRIGARAWQREPVEAPALEGDTVPGGTRTLDLQAVSPARAFCVARLRAEPLELPVRGIDSRLKGRLIHAVLERLLDPAATGEAEARLARCIDAAFGELVGPCDASWETQIRAERVRIERLVTGLLETEAARPPFETIAVERRTEIAIAGWRIRCRIDRADRLCTGEEILIDYKTGRFVSARWFDERLTDCQLPLYAVGCGADGILTIRLAGSGIEYRGAGRETLSLPGRQRTFDDESWQRQLGRWREQITGLLEELAHGDLRVRADAADFVGSDAREHAGGAFAPLTRVGDDE